MIFETYVTRKREDPSERGRIDQSLSREDGSRERWRGAHLVVWFNVEFDLLERREEE